ncbi:hypothetical protein [Aureibacter tunicatorum]|uniref:Uncharacterized protein n=1 Tax=Aureibacter tunicatorum TaxID=866807 RepID=A0AAE4BUV4_9BACT|nr:hypothetical protein [Aureibacter tunicatorum]MDR6241450.1 hypothetical protein [Aureibacter tunicatorum]BDD06705.1 hypothetical protein AUTU_41880 [Aureibacter tunicatorum]
MIIDIGLGKSLKMVRTLFFCIIFSLIYSVESFSQIKKAVFHSMGLSDTTKYNGFINSILICEDLSDNSVRYSYSFDENCKLILEYDSQKQTIFGHELICADFEDYRKSYELDSMIDIQLGNDILEVYKFVARDQSSCFIPKCVISTIFFTREYGVLDFFPRDYSHTLSLVRFEGKDMTEVFEKLKAQTEFYLNPLDEYEKRKINLNIKIIDVPEEELKEEVDFFK